MIFQASFYQCLIPMDWKSANVVPVVKKGEKLFQAITDQCPTPAYPANY